MYCLFTLKIPNPKFKHLHGTKVLIFNNIALINEYLRFKWWRKKAISKLVRRAHRASAREKNFCSRKKNQNYLPSAVQSCQIFTAARRNAALFTLLAGFSQLKCVLNTKIFTKIEHKMSTLWVSFYLTGASDWGAEAGDTGSNPLVCARRYTLLLGIIFCFYFNWNFIT